MWGQIQEKTAPVSNIQQLIKYEKKNWFQNYHYVNDEFLTLDFATSIIWNVDQEETIPENYNTHLIYDLNDQVFFLIFLILLFYSFCYCHCFYLVFFLLCFTFFFFFFFFFFLFFL
jgi:hypothetical protein